MYLSPSQLGVFWRMWAKVEAESLPSTSTKAEREEFRRTLIRRVCQVESLRHVRPGREFGQLMFEAARMAEDYEAAAYWGNDQERRTAAQIGDCARQIGEIVGESMGWKYCCGVFRQAGLPDRWEDVPADLLESVFRMLDTHRRRLLKRDHGWRGARAGQPLGYVFGRVYVRPGLAVVGYQDPAESADLAS